MKEWHFNTLFLVAVGSVVLTLLGPSVGIEIDTSGPALTSVGAILAYILTQKHHIVKKDDEGGDENDD